MPSQDLDYSDALITLAFLVNFKLFETKYSLLSLSVGCLVFCAEVFKFGVVPFVHFCFCCLCFCYDIREFIAKPNVMKFFSYIILGVL